MKQKFVLTSRLAAIFLIGFLMAGCGNSREQFVFTGTSGAPLTGSLTFNFAGQQGSLALPQGTTDLRFEYFESNNGTGNAISTETRAVGDTITFDQVPTNVGSVRVTAFDANGFPLQTAVAPVTVVGGQNVVVDLSNANIQAVTVSSVTVTPANASIEVGQTQQYTATVNFSSGDVVPNAVVTWSAVGSATVNATGLATGQSVGQATITATVGGVSGDATLNVTPPPVTVGPGRDFATIQAAIDDIEANGQAGTTVVIDAGNYTAEGAIVINDSPNLTGLVLRGANAGTSAGINPGTRGAESIVAAFDIDNQVTVDGFEVMGGPTSAALAEQGFFLNDGATGTVIRNNVVDYGGVVPLGTADLRGILTITTADPSNLVIEFNHFEGWTGAVYLQGTLPGPVRTGGHTVRGNVAENNNVGFSNDAVQNTTFVDNVVSSLTGEAFGFDSAGTGILINNNDIEGEAINAFNLNSNQDINAENNWWGQATGPNAGQVGGSDTNAVIDSDPFLNSDPVPTIP